MDLSGLLGNSFVQGGAALGIIGGFLASVRTVPGTIWSYIKRQFMVTATVRSDNLVNFLSLWLAEQEYAKKSRLLDAVLEYQDTEWRGVLRPGLGGHIFTFKGTRFWLHHDLEDQGALGKKHIMSLKMFGRSKQPMLDLIQEVVECANAQREDKTLVYINEKWGGWDELRILSKRSLESLFLPHDVKDDIFSDARKFFANEQWYRERGIPHRRGYLLHGPAGNGKSTVIHVLASEFDLPIYMLTLSDPDVTDTGIASVIGKAPAQSIIVLEDFEKINFGAEKMKITIPGLLNAIDGSLASEGRILIITANTLEPINEYFLRPGRIDRVWEIGPPEESVIRECVELFDGHLDHEALVREAVDGAWSMAQLHQRLIQNAEMPDIEFQRKPRRSNEAQCPKV